MSSMSSMETLMLHLLHRAEQSRSEEGGRKRSMLAEVRTLEFWRAIIAECMASFFYVFLACGAHVNWPHHPPPNTATKAFASGMAMAAVAQCFGHVSGAHANPACTIAMLVTRKITPLRSFLYVTSQCGGAIAGAALLYGVAVAGGTTSQTLGCNDIHESLSIWQAICLELALTFVIVFTIYAVLDPNRRTLGSEAIAVGTAYFACSLTAIPATGASLNPARTLGPAFVMNRWNNHWIYWCGPLSGGLLAGLIYEYIFDNDKKSIPHVKNDEDDDTEKDSHAKEEEDECEPKSSKSLDPLPRIRLTQYQQQQQQPVYVPHQQQQPQQMAARFPRSATRASVQAVDGPHLPSGCSYADFYSSLPRPGYRTWNATPKF